MSWEKSSYTTAGAALLSESLSGGALTITRVGRNDRQRRNARTDHPCD